MLPEDVPRGGPGGFAVSVEFAGLDMGERGSGSAGGGEAMPREVLPVPLGKRMDMFRGKRECRGARGADRITGIVELA